MGDTIMNVQRYTLMVNAFPDRSTKARFFREIIDNIPHVKNAAELYTRVSIGSIYFISGESPEIY